MSLLDPARKSPRVATPQANHLPGTLLRLSARGLGDGRWWTPGPLTLGAILARTGIPSTERDQAVELASQVDGWALRGTLPNPGGVAVRIRVSAEHGPAFVLDKRRGREGWEYRIFRGAAPSEGPQAPAAPPAAHLEARPAPARPPVRAPQRPPSEQPAPSWLRPERVVSAAERGLVDDDDRPVVSDPAQLRAAPPAAPAAPPPPPPPPPVAPPEADLLPAVKPGARDGAGVLPAAPAETDPDRIGVAPRKGGGCKVDGCDQPRRAARLCRAHYEEAYTRADRAAAATEQTPAAAETPSGDPPAPDTEQPLTPRPKPLRPRCTYKLCRSRSAIGGTLCTRHAETEARAAARAVQAPALCSLEGCGKQAIARGLCNAHYQAQWQAQRAAKAAEAGLELEPRRRRQPLALDRAARELWARLQDVPALGPWVDETAGAFVRRRLSDHSVAARLTPEGGKNRWVKWSVEAITPEGSSLRVNGKPAGRDQAKVVVDTLLRSAGWGLV